jgi:predicted Zn-ribbon and HTH transcriptional regulator
VHTIRQEMIIVLGKTEMSARELSQAMGIREKEVYEHLSHIARSAAAQGKKLIVQPFRCRSCGYVFQDRKRLTRPSRCPRCKKSHLEEATYRVL